MNLHEFRFVFNEIVDGICHATRFSVNNENLTFEVRLDDSQIAKISNENFSPLLADIIDLALAVYTADRLTPRTQDAFTISIELPLRLPEIFTKLKDALSYLLMYFTDDNWTFEFTKRQKSERRIEISHDLFPKVNASEVALWSGGLDALGGLYYRNLRSDTPIYTLFGTGSNAYIHKIQRELYGAVQGAILQKPLKFAKSEKLRLVQLPLYSQTSNRIHKNSTPRGRGFVFLLLGAVCAILEGQNTLFVYENGIGAINLPFRSSELGLDHSRAVNPKGIRQMSNFLSQILGNKFTISNPFEFMTKAQVCKDLVSNSQISYLLTLSTTCDRRRHAFPMQCGRCSSCLLRREALAINGFIEPPNRYESTQLYFQGRQGELTSENFFDAMNYQVEVLKECFSTSNPWNALIREFNDLEDVADAVISHDELPEERVHKKLIGMYETYVQEWQKVSHLLE